MKASDWCTCWPDKWRGYDYSACCQKHDEDYANPEVSRWEADRDLFRCVWKESYLVWACVMFTGVRCFGWAFRHYVPKSK